jgi:hypothetical protein
MNAEPYLTHAIAVATASFDSCDARNITPRAATSIARTMPEQAAPNSLTAAPRTALGTS